MRDAQKGTGRSNMCNATKHRPLAPGKPGKRLALLIVTALFCASPVLPHSWYPWACCGDIDCFPVTCDQLVETVSGWLYVPTGNLFKREQVQLSQDHNCHVCLALGRDRRSICAFIVPNV